MWLKLITCEVLARTVYLAAARSPHTVDVELIEMGLHTYPDRLRAELQRRLDAADAVGYDAVLLGYGLCCNSVAGLQTGQTRLVLPRAHDCITLFLGSRQRYEQEFISQPGTYYYTADYIERSRHRNSTDASLLPLGSSNDEKVQATYEEYVQKYGKDNADYLMEVMGAWKQHYTRAAYIHMGVGDESACEQLARDEAERRGWSFERLEGNQVLVHRLVEGQWDGDFLVVEPRGKVVPAYDSEVVDWVEGDLIAGKDAASPGRASESDRRPEQVQNLGLQRVSSGG